MSNYGEVRDGFPWALAPYFGAQGLSLLPMTPAPYSFVERTAGRSPRFSALLRPFRPSAYLSLSTQGTHHIDPVAAHDWPPLLPPHHIHPGAAHDWPPLLPPHAGANNIMPAEADEIQVEGIDEFELEQRIMFVGLFLELLALEAPGMSLEQLEAFVTHNYPLELWLDHDLQLSIRAWLAGGLVRAIWNRRHNEWIRIVEFNDIVEQQLQVMVRARMEYELQMLQLPIGFGFLN